MIEEKGRRIAAGREPQNGMRRRGEALESAILLSDWDVLEQHGYRGFTIEAVASRAGTSRSVIYRRWSDVGKLLEAAVGHAAASSPITIPDTGNLRDDAIGLLRNVNSARALKTARIALQLIDYFRDTGTSFENLRGRLAAGRISGSEIIARRAHERGELDELPTSKRVINLPLDLLRYEIFTTLKPASNATITEIVDDLWIPLIKVR